MDSKKYFSHIQTVLDNAVNLSKDVSEGYVADYIPELLNVEEDYVAASISLSDGGTLHSGGDSEYIFTLQSTAKLVLLIGLIEEYGENRVFSWIDAEPSGHPFASVAQLERFGPIPSNPLVNAGAIALTGHIPGNLEEQKVWIHRWMKALFNAELEPNLKVFESELRSGDRNRSLAYLMKSTGVLYKDIEEVLQSYFLMCSYQANIKQASYLPMILSNGGLAPDGTRVISESTSNSVVSIMATCGMYNESGMHLVRIGMPTKSGVSGLVLSVATGRGGVAAFSPKLNKKGNSIRGQIILNEVSNNLNWHFASPWGYARIDSSLHPSEFDY